MKTGLIALLACGVGLALPGSAFSVDYCGIAGGGGPVEDSQFADCVVSYDEGSPECADTSKVIGWPLCNGDMCELAVSLNSGGSMVVRFVDNLLTTSADSQKDLWIFEEEPGIEETDVSISQDNVSWIPVGRVGPGTNGIDIDAFIGSGVVLGETYAYVKLDDVGNDPSAYGADINAVQASSSITLLGWEQGCPPPAQASTVCGQETAHQSNLLNVLSILLLPMAAVFFLRIWRRKR